MQSCTAQHCFPLLWAVRKTNQYFHSESNCSKNNCQLLLFTKRWELEHVKQQTTWLTSPAEQHPVKQAKNMLGEMAEKKIKDRRVLPHVLVISLHFLFSKQAKCLILIVANDLNLTQVSVFNVHPGPERKILKKGNPTASAVPFLHSDMPKPTWAAAGLGKSVCSGCCLRSL